MEVMTSPYKLATDSPSRQLLYELSRLAVTTREDFYARLDREHKEKEAVHHHALATAALEHDRVRRRAEQEREKLELQLQIERERREEEKRRELERKRQEEAERELAEKEAERVRAAEATKKKENEAIAARKAEIAEAERKKVEKATQDAEIVKQRKDAQDTEKKNEVSKEAMQKAKEVAISAQKQRQLQTPSNQPLDSSSVGKTLAPPVDKDQDREAEHRRYIEIHRNLKQLRKFMMAEAKKQDVLIQHMGNMRREIKKSVGQITEGKGANKTPFKKIISIFKAALQVTEPKVEITMFLANPPSPLPSSDTKAPGLLVYLVNIFAKAIVSQFIDEAGVSPKTADPVGLVASNIFAMDDFRWQGISLIDILISKMHVVCPVLWGVYGDESTAEGKSRLGWSREDQDGPWISEQRHQERMTGLGAGFAAIALRKYEKAKAENPYPNIKYWQSFAAIINVPQKLITATHMVVLKAMIEGSESKFLELFGNAGLVALRVALIEYPTKAVPPSVAAKALAGLADVLRRDKKLFL